MMEIVENIVFSMGRLCSTASVLCEIGVEPMMVICLVLPCMPNIINCKTAASVKFKSDTAVVEYIKHM